MLAEREPIFAFKEITHNSVSKSINTFAPHELNVTDLKRYASGFGVDYTASKVTLRTMMELLMGVSATGNQYAGRTRYNSPSTVQRYKHVASHEKAITSMCYAPKLTCGYNNFFTASEDGTVKCWDATRKVAIFTLSGGLSSCPLYCLLLHPTTGQLYAGASDGTVKVWNTLIPPNSSGIKRISSSNSLTSMSSDNSLGFSLEDLPEVSSPSSLQFMYENIKRNDSSTYAVDPSATYPRNPHHKHTNDVTSLALSNDGMILYSGSEDGKIKAWAIPPLSFMFNFTMDKPLLTDPSYLISERKIMISSIDQPSAKRVGDELFSYQVGNAVKSIAVGPEAVPIVNGNKVPDKERCMLDKLYAADGEDNVTVWDCKPDKDVSTRNKGEFRSVTGENERAKKMVILFDF